MGKEPTIVLALVRHRAPQQKARSAFDITGIEIFLPMWSDTIQRAVLRPPLFGDRSVQFAATGDR
ncbi:MAG TPA: hypothetical protein VEF72_26440 [Mycobacterium sp.]|nr:hypothetical protein [Mycobacterium sp.]